MTLRLSKTFKIQGLGKMTKKQRAEAMKRIEDVAQADAGVIVDGVAERAGKDNKLSPKERAVAITFVKDTLNVSDKVAREIVRQIFPKNRISGAGFWSDVGNWFKGAAHTVLKAIPVVGPAANELWRSVETKTPYKWKSVLTDTAVGALPGGPLVKGAVNLALDKTGAKKAITQGLGVNTRSKKKQAVDKNQPKIDQYIEPKPKPRKRATCASASERGKIVSAVMKENPGMNLGQASKYVKEHGLWKRF